MVNSPLMPSHAQREPGSAITSPWRSLPKPRPKVSSRAITGTAPKLGVPRAAVPGIQAPATLMGAGGAVRGGATLSPPGMLSSPRKTGLERLLGS